MKKKRLGIIGTGGFAREAFTCFIDSTKGQGLDYSKEVVFIERDEVYKDSEIMGIPVLRRSEFNAGDFDIFVAIGEPAIRKKVVEELPAETTYRSIIHPTAVISDWVEIGEGSIVTAGSILTCNIKIGKHCHLNLLTTIGHDCVIGDYFTTAPGVNISGICTFGDCVYFGTNASVRQDIRITNNVTIGMGGVVVKDITEPGIYIGSPVKKLER